MMNLNKEIEHHRKLFKKEVSDNMPVILESERGVMIVTTTGYDDFEKLMDWMGYMEKEIKWVISGTYDNPYAKYVLDEGLGKVNTMNKYQKAYQNVQVELPHNSNDIVVLRELVEKENPKKWDKDYVLEQINCPICGKYWNIIDNCTETFRYCPNCGQKLDWSEEND